LLPFPCFGLIRSKEAYSLIYCQDGISYNGHDISVELLSEQVKDEVTQTNEKYQAEVLAYQKMLSFFSIPF